MIIDDMGIKQLPPNSGELLFEIVMRRYEARSTLMTSNRPIEEWGKLLGDVPAASAILDRFLHHAQIIQITGCIKNMKRLIDKIDFILELHVEGAFSVEKDLAKAICRILGKEKPANKLF